MWLSSELVAITQHATSRGGNDDVPTSPAAHDEAEVRAGRHGYFTDKDAAQAFVDELDAPAIARYAEQKAAFDKKVKAWEQKQAKAQSLGFSNPDMRPAWPPVKPLPHLVVEVSPNQPKAED